MTLDETRQIAEDIVYLKNCVTSIHLGMYGDKQNKVAGLIDKVDCLIDYKPELKWLRRVRNNFWKIILAIFTGVSISVISGYLIWEYIKH